MCLLYIIKLKTKINEGVGASHLGIIVYVKLDWEYV